MILLIALVVYTFAAFGFCWIVGGARVSLPFREWLAEMRERKNIPAQIFLELIECPGCLGFWVGFLIGLVGLLRGVPWLPPPTGPWILSVLGFYTAGVNFCLGRATGLIDKP